jgi:hypothetical protein
MGFELAREGGENIKRRGLVFSVLGVVMGLATVALFWLTSHFNPLTGVYTYDPRTDQPGDLVLASRPDVVFVEALTKQIERDETYPPDAASKVVAIMPIRVALSLHTDWQVYAYVTTRLNYADGTSRVEEFRFFSQNQQRAWLPWVGDIVAYHVYYAPLTGCQEAPGQPAQSVCDMQLQ